jgi:uncharacterized protein (TIGR01244 family)
MALRPLFPGVFVAGQIDESDLDAAAAAGVRHIISNRPDGEEPGQPDAAAVAAAVEARGMSFIHAPARGLPDDEAVALVDEVLASGEPVLLFCRSGMRSTAAWALASVRSGRLTVEEAVNAGAGAGYDIRALPF